MFNHLHGHSTFSFLEAIGKPLAIINKAKELEMASIAITDYNGMYGIIKFYQQANDAGIKPLIGIETGFVMDINSNIVESQIWNIVVLATNKQAYQNLMELTSFANKEGLAMKPKIDLAALQKFGEGMICFFWWTDSRLGKMISLDEKESKIIEIIGMIQNAVGKDHVFLEIIAQEYKYFPELKKVNEFVTQIADKEHIPCIIGNNFFYPDKTDKQAWEVALSIKDGTKIYDENRRKPKWAYHIMTEDEIRNICKKNGMDDTFITTCIEQNNKIADSIDVQIDLHQSLFPAYETPDDIREMYEEHMKKN